MPTTVTLTDTRLVTTWTQLRRRGYSVARIRAQLDSGRWRRWGYAVVLHNGPLTQRQGWLVARAHAGPSAVLTAFTAARFFGLRGWERHEVHVLAPRGARRVAGCPIPLTVHRVLHWESVRMQRRRPVQACADALLVAAGTFTAPRPACGILAAAVQQRIATARALSEALHRSPRLRHRRLLICAVADIAQGSEALSAIDFVRLCRRYDLPEPIRQAVRIERFGRRRYLDGSWRRFDGRLVVVEVDGALHLAPQRWWDDQLRQNELALADALVLRFPSVVVRTEPAVVAEQLRRALQP
ncbi:MAG: hypothetical protein JWO57_4195 [Pseudonocardiales bacterium]|nr:hypothetical protein [Pseudonocardiales bacterium]